MRSLVGIHPDDRCRHACSSVRAGWEATADRPDVGEVLHASLESGRSGPRQATRSLSSQPPKG
jgi:hypothetical protein